MVTPLASAVDTRIRAALDAALPAEVSDADPQIRPSDHADYQANGILPLAKPLRSNPRELATKVAAALDHRDLIETCEVSGPGFLNINVADTAILRQVAARVDDTRLGIRVRESSDVTVIDYSQPNIAKEMHVGHLRSTIIGDALVRTLQFDGNTVIRQNHLGDWGTQFGMLIQYLVEHPEAQGDSIEDESGTEAISRLNALYRLSREKFDSDEAFADRARGRVVELQSGDEPTLEQWRGIVAESKIYFNEIYDRLGVLLTDEDAVGESFYNPFLRDVTSDLEERGIAVRSDGALCVFFDDVRGPDGNQVPLIVEKSDGGFTYATTDLAAIRHRVNTLGAQRILYVVDSRQALHFRMVFETARRAGYLPADVEAIHVSFGSVLGPDGKPFKTRAGDTVRLISLLDDAVEHASKTVQEKNPDLPTEAIEQLSRQVGIGAVKYADLATSRTRDYIFDIDRMVSLQGNTGVYLQYAFARIQSILAKVPVAVTASAITDSIELEPAERELAMLLDEFDEVVTAVVAELEPHRLSGFLFAVAQAFTEFYGACPVLKAPSDEIRDNRLALCKLTGRTLELGLDLLGIAAPERL